MKKAEWACDAIIVICVLGFLGTLGAVETGHISCVQAILQGGIFAGLCYVCGKVSARLEAAQIEGREQDAA